MSQEPETQDHAALQHEAEHAKPRKRGSVLGYLTILFAAAFLLLMMSYLQQQRNNDELQKSNEAVIIGLKESVSAVQSIENLIAERDTLSEQVERLSAEKKHLEQALSNSEEHTQASQAATDASTKAAQAMDWLAEIQALYGMQYYKTCRTMITAFEATGLVASLPAASLTTYDGAAVTAPAQRYQAIYDDLFPQGQN